MPHYAEAPAKDKKKFRKYLAEDEEIVVVTGFGKNYLRHRFAYYTLLPGVIFWLLGVAVVYFYLVPQGLASAQLWRWSVSLGLLLGMAVALVSAYLKVLWDYHSHRYLLTNRRLIIKKGFFSVKLTSAMFDKITHLEVDQGLIDRLVMKHGDVIINTAGVHKDDLRLRFIDYPIEFKNLMERLINREREYLRQHDSLFAVEGELVEDKKRRPGGRPAREHPV